jgi:MerR family transcriptional regulator/heat shock protein HspR
MQRNNRRTAIRTVRTVFEAMVTQQMTPSQGPPARRSFARASQPQEIAEGVAPEEGLYIISVAARILSMHPQTLRKYERVGLVRPSRTIGMLRLYSEEDIIKLRMIKRLVDELRLNLAGVVMVMGVFDHMATARFEMTARSGATARAFDRMFDQIMEMFLGPRTAEGQ